MHIPTRAWAHCILVIIGALLMILGIVTKAPGASIGGLIVAAVNLPPCEKAIRERSRRRYNKP
jgi:hypothetical protein